MAQGSRERQPELVAHERFPRASAYDPAWVLEHEMGPNVLWLTEFLCEALALRPGMRVLDLGCGKALSAIFLAREFGVQVWATDLWIPATENAGRIRAAGLEEQIFPIYADARRLPYADEFFDAIVSVDAFEYFGTDGSFLPSLVRLLRPGCQIGIANVGVLREVELLPDDWPWDFCNFHTTAWWRRHWAITRCVEVEVADDLSGSLDLWRRWNRATGETGDDYLRSPAAENLSIHRIVARRV
ncbi:MAG: methyltransferase domain-containing protein [Chloroflexia bacterium]